MSSVKKISKRKQKKLDAKKLDQMPVSFQSSELLAALKPREKYVFHSDYFEIDGRVGSIMAFFRPEGSLVDFGPFWGVNKIPNSLGPDVNVVLFDQVRRMTRGWVDSHQTSTEKTVSLAAEEQDRGGSTTERHKVSKRLRDLDVIAQELQDGAAYLQVHSRILVTAPDLETLDAALLKLERLYIDRFVILSASAYSGQQRDELATLFSKNERKTGKPFYFTSSEYAGSYSLVTHGLEDPGGEYVGYMTGDVNTSAILFDVNRYEHHCVISDDSVDESRYRIHASDLWGSKLSQACLIEDHKVVHLILDGLNLDTVGPRFKNLSYKIDMNRGDVNMFEMFGERKDQLAVFPTQMQKLILMGEQAYETTESDRSIIRGSLENIATQFYIDNRMWFENAVQHQDDLRVIGIPHVEVPKLEMFVTYLDTAYRAALAQGSRDNEKIHALNVLNVTFRNMLTNNGDLFNTITTSVIDNAKTGRRVIYDFSDLMPRGRGVAMAQLVNVIGFAVGNLGQDDVLIIHGAEIIHDSVKPYLTTQFNRLFDKGGRVVFCYNDTARMLEDKMFSHFDRADYTIFGTLTDPMVDRYQELMGQKIPADLARLITTKGESLNYIRRGYDNVVFRRRLCLGLEKRGGHR